MDTSLDSSNSRGMGTLRILAMAATSMSDAGLLPLSSFAMPERSIVMPNSCKWAAEKDAR